MRPRWFPDPFILALLATVALASFVPCYGEVASFFSVLTTVAIALLFFLHGVRLAREAIIAGLGHWRLHISILCCTFVVYPLVGFGLSKVLPGLLPVELWAGVLFLCMLPSTVQSSIAFTSIARGNIPGAVCAAAASNLIGILLTPVLVGVFLRAHAAISPAQLWKIIEQLLIPFVLGHLLRPWLIGFAHRHRYLLTLTDRGSILLVVYTAFSAAVIEGIWRAMPLRTLAVLFAVEVGMFIFIVGSVIGAARLLKFSREDEIAIVMCGSKKSLASGVPMANVLFAGGLMGSVVLPVMIYHQMQLMAAAWIAGRYAKRSLECVDS
jgi:sodium/bile acid cotransporter 7